MSESASNPARPPATFPKQAVVVIHGIGEQMPMDTITGFVRAVWETDSDIAKNGMPDPDEVWSKPDARTGSLELRRITTRQSTSTGTFPKGVRTDFYELYWADLSGGSTLSDVENWIFGLLLRNPFTRVPRKLILAWLLLLLLTVGILYLAGAALFKPEFSVCGWKPYGWMEPFSTWLGPMLAAVLAWLSNNLLLPYVGRIVRYTRATPENISARKAIRERGLALLDALHDGSYERIILVGHSLGSMLGYDLLSYFWAARLASHTFAESSQEFALLMAVETARADCAREPSPANLAAFRAAQRTLCQGLRRRPKPVPSAGKTVDPEEDPRWLITDFITLGSPLTHSEILLTSGVSAFRDRVETRQFPVAPPIRELLDPNNKARAAKAGFPLAEKNPALMSFPFGSDLWQLHHAAPFAAVRWTNIYDPARLVFFGDVISGPLAPLFGNAVVDVNLAEIPGKPRGFTHTKYWDLGAPGASVPGPVLELRKALNLAGQQGEV